MDGPSETETEIEKLLYGTCSGKVPATGVHYRDDPLNEIPGCLGSAGLGSGGVLYEYEARQRGVILVHQSVVVCRCGATVLGDVQSSNLHNTRPGTPGW